MHLNALGYSATLSFRTGSVASSQAASTELPHPLLFHRSLEARPRGQSSQAAVTASEEHREAQLAFLAFTRWDLSGDFLQVVSMLEVKGLLPSTTHARVENMS